MLKLSVEQAQLICDANSIDAAIAKGEERDMLQEQNPELLAAYDELYRFAYGELSESED